MTCIKCESFRILYEPIRNFDCGRAACEKHNLVKDFMSHRELKRLSCNNRPTGGGKNEQVDTGKGEITGQKR